LIDAAGAHARWLRGQCSSCSTTGNGSQKRNEARDPALKQKDHRQNFVTSRESGDGTYGREQPDRNELTPLRIHIHTRFHNCKIFTHETRE
jgi:hypothetical protein